MWLAPFFIELKKGLLSYILVDMHRRTRALIGRYTPVLGVFWRCVFYAHAFNIRIIILCGDRTYANYRYSLLDQQALRPDGSGALENWSFYS